MWADTECPGTRRAEHPPQLLTHPPHRTVEAGARLEMVCQVQVGSHWSGEGGGLNTEL